MMKNRSYFGWLKLISGLLMLLLGVFTFIRPDGTAGKLVMLYAVVAVITGVCDIVFFVKAERYGGVLSLISLVAGVLSVMCGASLLMYPMAGAWVTSLLFPIWFIAHCVAQLMNLNITRSMAGHGSYYFTLIVNVLGLVFGLMMLLHPLVSPLSANAIVGFYLIAMGIDDMAIGLSKLGNK